MEATARGIQITTDASRIDLEAIHGFLTTSYWSPAIPREVVERAIAHSLCFGALDGDQQVGFARVVSDRATFAYVCDVFVLESHRGRGVGKSLMAAIMAHPDLQGLRRIMLFSRDAHGLYAQYGFGAARYPDRLMEVFNPHPYGAGR
jgi:GNAT superfamily N-acetyltransferase